MAKDEEYHVHRTGNHARGEGLHGVYQNKTRARNTADKLDNEYGAYAHRVKVVPKVLTHESAEKLGRGKPYGHKGD